MRYYLYVSSAKVDMLWSQISMEDLKRIAAELRVDVGGLSASVKSQPTDPNLYTKLDVVLRYLNRRQLVGALDEPRAFFRGTIPMRMQEVDFYRGSAGDGRMVLFSGSAESDKVVGLIGSAAFVTGMDQLEPASLDYAQPSFWNRIAEQLSPPSEEEINRNMYDLDVHIEYEARRRKDGEPMQEVDFAAKTFVSEEDFLLGSPLYVALAEQIKRDKGFGRRLFGG
jgi:hypothetical protein